MAQLPASEALLSILTRKLSVQWVLGDMGPLTRTPVALPPPTPTGAPCPFRLPGRQLSDVELSSAQAVLATGCKYGASL